MPARLSPRNRAKRGAKTAGAQSEDVPLFTRRRTGGEWVEVATLPHHQQAIAAQSREARCKNSRSAERGCSSVHPPPNRRRMGGGSNLAPAPTGYRRAIARSAVQKTAGAQSEDVPLVTRRRTGGEWVEVATLPHHQQAIAAQSREARCKNSRSAERCARKRVSERNRRRRHLARR